VIPFNRTTRPSDPRSAAGRRLTWIVYLIGTSLAAGTSFADSFLQDPQGDVYSAHLDLISASITRIDTTHLEFSMTLAADIPEVEQGNTVYYMWLVDTDRDPSTGFPYAHVGGEFNVRAANHGDGWFGVIEQLAKSNEQITLSIDGSEIKLTIARSQIGDPSVFDWEVETYSSSAAGDTTDYYMTEAYDEDLVVTAVVIDPPELELLETWWGRPKVSIDSNFGTYQIPPFTVDWSSSDPNVADADSEGRIIASTAGVATLTANIQGKTGSTVVTVASPVLPPTHDRISPYLAEPVSNALYVNPVVLIAFLPTQDGEQLDITVNPDFYSPNPISLIDLKYRIDIFTQRVKFMREEGTRYRGFADIATPPSLGYRIIDYLVFYEILPPSDDFYLDVNGQHVFMPDFHQILDRIDARTYVEELGVKEFWIWYSGFDSGQPVYDPAIHDPADFRGTWESNMSSPSTGDISNSNRDNSDLPLYKQTYLIYPYGFRRTNNEAIHNYGHQLEAILGYIDFRRNGNNDLFWNEFVGAQDDGSHVTGRCGWTHMPPNTTGHYDYYNTTIVDSDIADWRPDGLGATTPVNVDTWEQHPYQWPPEEGEDPPDFGVGEAHWYIYWMQSMPGRDNEIPSGLEEMTNWWLFSAAWDSAIEAGLGLSSPQCDWTVSIASLSAKVSGGSASVEVTAPLGCPWISSSNDYWISVEHGKTGSGDGTVGLQIQANDGSARIGSVAVAGNLVTVLQPGAIIFTDDFESGNTNAWSQ